MTGIKMRKMIPVGGKRGMDLHILFKKLHDATQKYSK